MSTETPLTDSFTFDLEGDDVMKTELVSADFARSLERRNSELTARIAELEKDCQDLRNRDIYRENLILELRNERADLRDSLAEARKDSARIEKLAQFFSFEDVDYDEAAQRSCYGWTVRDESLTEAMGGSLGLPDPSPTFREAVDRLPATPLPETEGQL